MKYGEQYLQMMRDASKGLKVRGSDLFTNNIIIGVALEVAQHNEHIQDRRQLKRIIYAEARKRFKRSQYNAISWAWLLWWVLPKVIEWFLVWWFQQRERA